mmetsp:Transcript_97016/g.172678  ORF Transcript_97016/g.172678 Transcript_97016/m.172678 type:complete len:257 (-) Transcript_97016:179-949(-)
MSTSALLDSARSPTLGLVMSNSSFFGFLRGADQYGRWVPQQVVSAKAIAGGSTLDFSQALFVYPVITVHAHAFWGGVTLVVPPNVRVEQDGRALLGGFGAGGGVYHRGHGAMPTTASNSEITIKIEGTAVMGAVTAAVNRKASPAQLLSWQEAIRIIQEDPAPASTTREDMKQQIIGEALSKLSAREDMRQQIIISATLSQRLASAPPAAAAAIQHVLLQQGANATFLQNPQQGVLVSAPELGHPVVEGVPVEVCQ